VAEDPVDSGSDEGAEAGAKSRGEPRPKRGAGAHLKRYGVFYAAAAAIVLIVALLPTTGGDDDDEPASGDVDGEVVADGPWRPGSGDIEHGTGTTRGGIPCEPGVGQIEDSVLSVPCLPEFTGDNGGETYRGVTEDTIRIVRRVFPATANSEAVDREQEAAGFATDDVIAEVRSQFVDHLDDQYELYGRKVEIIEYESRFGNGTDEALGQGREGACQDATLIVEELDAFGVVGDPENGTLSGVFAECAAERDLVVFAGGAHYPESFYADLHPYVWNTVMDCEQVARHVAAYIGTRLSGQPAQYAGDPEMASRERKFGSYSPESVQYSKCNDLTLEILQDEYDIDTERGQRTPPVRYALDISRFADQAARAVVQWKAEDVTTVILSSDPVSVGFLTQAAEEQDYHPEWVLIGTAATDTDNFGRSYAQSQVDGHMFGISQLSASDRIYGPESEAGRLYEKLNDEEIPGGTVGGLYGSVHMFNLLQAAGPELTPENIADGVRALPALGGDGAPIWHFGDGHTATKDAREIYWDGGAPPGPDEPDQSLTGAFVETYDGQRFQPDEWPAEDPPVYPDR
jgi:hypothetical protein